MRERCVWNVQWLSNVKTHRPFTNGATVVSLGERFARTVSRTFKKGVNLKSQEITFKNFFLVWKILFSSWFGIIIKKSN